MQHYLITATEINQMNPYTVGDRFEDKEAAANIGIEFIYAEQWRLNPLS